MSKHIKAFHRLKAAVIVTLLLLAYQQIAQTQNSPSEVIVVYPTQALTEIDSSSAVVIRK